MEPTQILLAPATIAALDSISQTSLWDKLLPVLSALGGALAGGCISHWNSNRLEFQKQKQEAQAVLNALVTEVYALVAIIHERGYAQELDKVIELLSSDTSEPIRFCIRIPSHYSRVYQAQVGKIGLLSPSMATHIIDFHQLLDSLVQDVTPGGVLAEQGGRLDDYKYARHLLNRVMTKADLVQERAEKLLD